jgi:CHAT domain-containing protein
MVVSRPDGAGFIDPRSEAQAVLQAIERSAPGRVVVEFLRPATLTNLRKRLKNTALPVDIVHFDGHGVFADNGEVAAGKHDGLTKASKAQDMGYLLFEDKDGNAERVSAEKLGDALNRQQVSLMVLSACQSAMMGQGEDALGCVAAQLTNRGIPAVLAMTYSVLVTTTQQLFSTFYGELSAGRSLGVALANARQDLYFEQKRGQRWRGKEQIELELEDWFLPAWYQAGGDITRKALQGFQTIGDKYSESKALLNLAVLLTNQPNRLLEAHQLATAALAIDRTLDSTPEIWKTYILLAKIVTTQGETDTAKEYRQLARTTKVAFAGTQYELQQHESFIAAVVAAVGDKAAQAELEPILTQGVEKGRGQIVAAIRRVLAGEREVEVLWDDLDLDDSMIIAAILGRV